MRRHRNLSTAAMVGLVMLAAPAEAQTRVGLQTGDVLLRVRGILVAPNESTTGIAPTFPAEHAKVDDSVMPEVDLTYMATDHIGFELIAATTKHDVDASNGLDLGSVWLLPPTLTLQYHFAPTSRFGP